MATLIRPKLAVALGLVDDDFDRGMDKAEGKLGGFGKSVGKLSLAMGAGIAAAAVTAGAGLLKIGADFDSLQDALRIGTGKTGQALDDLSQDALAVFENVPTSMENVGTAFTLLSQKTTDTGADLMNLAQTELELAQITGTDLATNIDQTARLFGDWGIATKDQTATLDELFRVTQATGVGVADLSALMVKFGSPMRELGFSFDETAALLGKFQKEGVNTELVMGSLRIALGKMSKAGVADPVKGLQEIVDGIANAGSAGEANAKAIEAFGARAGPDMAAAIREGRFAIGKLFDQIAGGTDTIHAAAIGTYDWRENLTLLTNRLQVMLLPAANLLFGLLNKLVLLITGPVLRAAELVTNAFARMGDWFAIFRGKGLNPVSAALRAFGTLLEHVKTGIKPLDKIIHDVGHAGAYFAQAIHDLLSGNPDKALKHIGDSFGFIWDAITTAFFAIPWAKIGTFLLDGLVSAFDWVAANGRRLIGGLLSRLFAAGETGGQATADFVIRLVGAIAGFLQEHGGEIAKALLVILGTGAAIQATILAATFALVAGFVKGMAKEIGTQWDPVIKPALQDAFDGLVAWGGPALMTVGRTLVSWLWTGIASLLPWLGVMLHEIPNLAVQAVVAVAPWLYAAGRDIVSAIWIGISSLGGWLWEMVTAFIRHAIVDAAKDALHIGSPSKVMMAMGEDTTKGFALGMEKGIRLLTQVSAQVGQTAVGGTRAIPARVAAGTGGTTKTVNIGAGAITITTSDPRRAATELLAAIRRYEAGAYA